MEEEHIDYDTIREDYNIYECENGQILKAKQIVADIMEKYEKSGKVGNLSFSQVSYVRNTKPIDTSDIEYLPTEQVTDEHIVKDLKFKIKKEVINIYETDKLIILVDPRVEKISVTNKKDKKGNPFLRYRTGTGISVIPKRPEKEK